MLDAYLRRGGIWEVLVPTLRRDADRCPELQALLRRIEKVLGSLPGEQNASGWGAGFSQLLTAFGWPGDRALTSREFQTVESWQNLLSSFAGLDLLGSQLTFSQALGRVRSMAAETSFQIEDPGAPVQVMGILEASGLHFDHLWITDLHDEVLPFPPRPNPFLPLAMQIENRVPRASAAIALQFAGKLFDCLLGSARDIVLSHPRQDGERTLEPTPLVSRAGWNRVELRSPVQSEWIAAMRQMARLETFTDDQVSALQEGGARSGGARLFPRHVGLSFQSLRYTPLGRP